MTDNEKAATLSFIIWRPFAQASWGEWADEHGNIAPDMTKPENWTQALEWLIHRLYMISFCEGGYDEGDPYICIIHTSNLHYNMPEKVKGQSVESIGHAFVKAAAQIYDLEHKQWPYTELK